MRTATAAIRPRSCSRWRRRTSSRWRSTASSPSSRSATTSAGFAAPKDYRLDLDDDRLTLHYTLPLAQPLLTKSAGARAGLRPGILHRLRAAERRGGAARRCARPGCRLAVYPAQGPDAAAAAALATIGPDQRELPAEMQGLTGGHRQQRGDQLRRADGRRCGRAQPAPRSAGEAAQMMAQGTGRAQATSRRCPLCPRTAPTSPTRPPPRRSRARARRCVGRARRRAGGPGRAGFMARIGGLADRLQPRAHRRR